MCECVCVKEKAHKYNNYSQESRNSCVFREEVFRCVDEEVRRTTIFVYSSGSWSPFCVLLDHFHWNIEDGTALKWLKVAAMNLETIWTTITISIKHFVMPASAVSTVSSEQYLFAKGVVVLDPNRQEEGHIKTKRQKELLNVKCCSCVTCKRCIIQEMQMTDWLTPLPSKHLFLCRSSIYVKFRNV